MVLRTKHLYSAYYGAVFPSPPYTVVTVGNTKNGKKNGCG